MPLFVNFLLAAQELLKIKVSVEPCLASVMVLMRGCSGTDEYEAGKEKNQSILTTKKLDYTTGAFTIYIHLKKEKSTSNVLVK